MPQARPVVSALLLCDLVIREEGTHKASLIGIVRSINVRRFPANMGERWVYAMLTEGRGDYRLRFDLVRLDDLAVVSELARLDVRMFDRNAVSELRFKLGTVYVERPGLYELQLLADDRLVGTRSFNVIQSLEDF